MSRHWKRSEVTQAVCPWCGLSGPRAAIKAGRGKWEKHGRIFSGNKRTGHVARVSSKRWKIVRVFVDHRPGFWTIGATKPDWGNYIACAHPCHERETS